MSGTTSTYTQANRINYLRGTAYPAVPANFYVALFTATPTQAGTGGVEVSGTGYARQAIPGSTAGWAAASGTDPTQTSNAAVVNFGSAGSAWGTVVGFALYDAVTGGNLLYVNALTASKVINNGDPVSFPIGALVVTED